MPKKFTVTKRWKSLSKEEQVRQVREAMAAKHTNESAAELLGTTPGSVAGMRRRNNIPALFKKEKAEAKKKPAPPKEEVVLKPKPEPPSRKLAASEATQCVHEEDGSRCAYERAPGSDKCRSHK